MTMLAITINARDFDFESNPALLKQSVEAQLNKLLSATP